ncbi:MAG: hypothetical protein IPJ41_14495 [Phycisphaerales bacterium]|nr:hypothetical protein [Phycisphaerales bacterium]
MTRTGTGGMLDYERLGELLEEQETLFLRLDALSKRQSGLVRAEETDDLLQVLQDRQHVVEALEGVSRSIEPFRSRWDEVMSLARPDQRERVRRRVERLAELASEIAARDESDRRTLEQRRDGLAGDLAGLGRARGAVSAYRPKAPPAGARFQDREG